MFECLLWEHHGEVPVGGYHSCGVALHSRDPVVWKALAVRKGLSPSSLTDQQGLLPRDSVCADENRDLVQSRWMSYSIPQPWSPFGVTSVFLSQL